MDKLTEADLTELSDRLAAVKGPLFDHAGIRIVAPDDLIQVIGRLSYLSRLMGDQEKIAEALYDADRQPWVNLQVDLWENTDEYTKTRFRRLADSIVAFGEG